MPLPFLSSLFSLILHAIHIPSNAVCSIPVQRYVIQVDQFTPGRVAKEYTKRNDPGDWIHIIGIDNEATRYMSTLSSTHGLKKSYSDTPGHPQLWKILTCRKNHTNDPEPSSPHPRPMHTRGKKYNTDDGTNEKVNRTRDGNTNRSPVCRRAIL